MNEAKPPLSVASFSAEVLSPLSTLLQITKGYWMEKLNAHNLESNDPEELLKIQELHLKVSGELCSLETAVLRSGGKWLDSSLQQVIVKRLQKVNERIRLGHNNNATPPDYDTINFSE